MTEDRSKLAALKSDVQLQEHQQRIRDRIASGDNRLLLYHGLGSGKSLSSLAAAEAAGGPYTAVAPASLRQNYQKEVEKFTENSQPDILSYTGLGMGKRPGSDPNTVIFDEAHRLRNPNTAGAQGAAQLAQKAKNVLLLTGTPVTNSPGDLASLLGILHNKSIDPAKFERDFVGYKKVYPSLLSHLTGSGVGEESVLQNEDKLRSLFRGKIDYQASKTPEGVNVDEQTIRVPLSRDQKRIQSAIRSKIPMGWAWKLDQEFPLSRPELASLNSFMTGLRQSSLSTLPFRADKNPLTAFDESSKLQRAMSDLKSELGSNPNKKAIIYSNFINAGLSPYAAALKRDRIPYGLFHGGLPTAERQQNLKDYNEGKLRALLLGPAGAEGISTKGTNLIQLLDPHWHESRLNQARGRGLRFDSHQGLPEDLKNVAVRRYVSKSEDPSWLMRFLGSHRQRTGDEILETLAARKEKLNDQFRHVLQDEGTEKKQEADQLQKQAFALGRAAALMALYPTEKRAISPQLVARSLFSAVNKGRTGLITPERLSRFVKTTMKWQPKAWQRASALAKENLQLGPSLQPTAMNMYGGAFRAQTAPILPPPPTTGRANVDWSKLLRRDSSPTTQDLHNSAAYVHLPEAVRRSYADVARRVGGAHTQPPVINTSNLAAREGVFYDTARHVLAGKDIWHAPSLFHELGHAVDLPARLNKGQLAGLTNHLTGNERNHPFLRYNRWQDVFHENFLRPGTWDRPATRTAQMGDEIMAWRRGSQMYREYLSRLPAEQRAGLMSVSEFLKTRKAPLVSYRHGDLASDYIPAARDAELLMRLFPEQPATPRPAQPANFMQRARTFLQQLLTGTTKTAAVYNFEGDVQGVSLRKTLHQILDERKHPGLAYNNAHTGEARAIIPGNKKHQEEILGILRKRLAERAAQNVVGAAGHKSSKRPLEEGVDYSITPLPGQRERMHPVTVTPDDVQNFVTAQGFDRLGAEPPAYQNQWLGERYRLAPDAAGNLVGAVPGLAKKQLFHGAPIYGYQTVPGWKDTKAAADITKLSPKWSDREHLLAALPKHLTDTQTAMSTPGGNVDKEMTDLALIARAWLKSQQQKELLAARLKKFQETAAYPSLALQTPSLTMAKGASIMLNNGNQRGFMPSQLSNNNYAATFPAGQKLPVNPNPLSRTKPVKTLNADEGGIQQAMAKLARHTGKKPKCDYQLNPTAAGEGLKKYTVDAAADAKGLDAFKSLDQYMKKAGLNSFQASFFGRLIRAGLSQSQIQTATKMAGDSFGTNVAMELNSGIEKMGFVSLIPKILPAAGRALAAVGRYAKPAAKAVANYADLGTLNPVKGIKGAIQSVRNAPRPDALKLLGDRATTGLATGLLNPYTGLPAGDSEGNVFSAENLGRTALSGIAGMGLGQLGGKGWQGLQRRALSGQGVGTSAGMVGDLIGIGDGNNADRLGRYGFIGGAAMPAKVPTRLGIGGFSMSTGKLGGKELATGLRQAGKGNLGVMDNFDLNNQAANYIGKGFSNISKAFKANPHQFARTAAITGGAGLGGYSMMQVPGIINNQANLARQQLEGHLQGGRQDFVNQVDAALTPIQQAANSANGLFSNIPGMFNNAVNSVGDYYGKNKEWLNPLLQAGGGAGLGYMLGGGRGAALGGIGAPLAMALLQNPDAFKNLGFGKDHSESFQNEVSRNNEEQDRVIAQPGQAGYDPNAPIADPLARTENNSDVPENEIMRQSRLARMA